MSLRPNALPDSEQAGTPETSALASRKPKPSPTAPRHQEPAAGLQSLWPQFYERFLRR